MQQMSFVGQNMFMIAKSIERPGRVAGVDLLTVDHVCVLVCNDELSDCLIIKYNFHTS